MLRFLTSPAFIAYASIPVTCGFIGWVTNWLALKMTFYPLRFIGIPPALGWQGIIPRKAAKIAGKAVDLITSRLVSQDEILEGIDPDDLGDRLRPVLTPVVERIVQDAFARQSATLWSDMPGEVRGEVLAQVWDDVRATLPEAAAEVTDEARAFFDVKALVLENLTGPNVALLNEIFLRCGSRELKFIELSGLYIGALMGVVQCAVFAVFTRWWLFPIVGLLVGYFTNWVALKMIFRPLEPRRYLVVTYQGMFLRRQDEISKEYGRLVATRLLTAPKVVDTIVRRMGTERLLEVIERHTGRAIDRMTDFSKGVLGVLLSTMSEAELLAIKTHASQQITEVGPACAKAVEGYLSDVTDVERLIYPRLRALPKPEFEDILHACFKEDEFILILVGAVLGLVVGLVQGFYVVAYAA
jgi:uncharacterized membrane protein YheB (UPF0754 family)